VYICNTDIDCDFIEQRDASKILSAMNSGEAVPDNLDKFVRMCVCVCVCVCVFPVCRACVFAQYIFMSVCLFIHAALGQGW
jgi:hypothetical protein